MDDLFKIYLMTLMLGIGIGISIKIVLSAVWRFFLELWVVRQSYRRKVRKPILH